jgi:hypothetical protein
MQRIPLIAVSALVFATLATLELPAQTTQNTVFLSDGNAASGGSNTFPWSREGLRYQTIFPSAKFSKAGAGAFIINDILVAPQLSMNPTIKTAVYDDIEIRMGATAQVVPTKAWATNNPKPTTVYRGPLRVTFEKGVWRGMGLPKPYLFIQTPTAPNLCVEFIMWKFNKARNSETVSIRAVTDTTTNSATRAFYFKWTTSQTTAPSTGKGAAKMGLVVNSGNFVPTETGCKGSTNAVPSIGSSTFPRVGKSWDLTLSGALPNSSAMLVIGFSDTKGFGGALPLDAGFLGAPSCFIWNENTFAVPATVNSAGNAKLNFLIPASGGNARVYAHWWNFDTKANTAGVTSSNYGKILLGT